MALIQDELVECSLMSLAHSHMWGLNYIINIMGSNYVALRSGFTHSWESYPRSNTTMLHITFLFRNLNMFPKLHCGLLSSHCYSFSYMAHGCELSCFPSWIQVIQWSLALNGLYLDIESSTPYYDRRYILNVPSLEFQLPLFHPCGENNLFLQVILPFRWL